MFGVGATCIERRVMRKPRRPRRPSSRSRVVRSPEEAEAIARTLLRLFKKLGGRNESHYPPYELQKGHAYYFSFHLNFNLGDGAMSTYKQYVNYGQTGAMGEKARSDRNKFQRSRRRKKLKS
jgi:hypothetical protein